MGVSKKNMKLYMVGYFKKPKVVIMYVIVQILLGLGTIIIKSYYGNKRLIRPRMLLKISLEQCFSVLYLATHYYSNFIVYNVLLMLLLKWDNWLSNYNWVKYCHIWHLLTMWSHLDLVIWKKIGKVWSWGVDFWNWRL